MVKPHDSIVIASGSTIMAFAEALSPSVPVNVVTSSLRVALALNSNENINLFQLGGEIHKKSLSVHNVNSAQFEQFSCSKLFIGVDGFNEEFGATTSNLEEATLTRRMMEICAHTIVLADSTKLTKRGFGKICSIDMVDTLVTDSGISPSRKESFENFGINVIIAG